MRNAIVFPTSPRPPLVCGGEHPSARAHQDREAGGALQEVRFFKKFLNVINMAYGNFLQVHRKLQGLPAQRRQGGGSQVR